MATEETGLTVKASTDAAVYDSEMAEHLKSLLRNEDGTVIGHEDLSDSDFGIPQLKICQTPKQHTDTGAPLGHLILMATGEHAASFDVIVMGVATGQSYMPAFDPKVTDAKPICHSSDGITADPEYHESGVAPTLKCADCPNRLWDKNADLPPLCPEQHKIYGLTFDGVPWVFYGQKTAMTAIKEYERTFAWRKKHFFETLTRVTTVVQTKDQTQWYNPVFKQLHDQPVPLALQIDIAKQLPAFRARLRDPNRPGDDVPAAPVQPSVPNEPTAAPAPAAAVPTPTTAPAATTQAPTAATSEQAVVESPFNAAAQAKIDAEMAADQKAFDEAQAAKRAGAEASARKALAEQAAAVVTTAAPSPPAATAASAAGGDAPY